MDDEEVYALCRGLAKAIMAKSPDLGEIEDSIIAKLRYDIDGYVMRCKNFNRDPGIVVRALRYLSYTHCMSGLGTDVNSYLAMLEVLIELAAPFSVHTSNTIVFLDDIEYGINLSKLRYQSKDKQEEWI